MIMGDRTLDRRLLVRRIGDDAHQLRGRPLDVVDGPGVRLLFGWGSLRQGIIPEDASSDLKSIRAGQRAHQWVWCRLLRGAHRPAPLSSTRQPSTQGAWHML